MEQIQILHLAGSISLTCSAPVLHRGRWSSLFLGQLWPLKGKRSGPGQTLQTRCLTLLKSFVLGSLGPSSSKPSWRDHRHHRGFSAPRLHPAGLPGSSLLEAEEQVSTGEGVFQRNQVGGLVLLIWRVCGNVVVWDENKCAEVQLFSSFTTQKRQQQASRKISNSECGLQAFQQHKTSPPKSLR